MKISRVTTSILAVLFMASAGIANAGEQAKDSHGHDAGQHDKEHKAGEAAHHGEEGHKHKEGDEAAKHDHKDHKDHDHADGKDAKK